MKKNITIIFSCILLVLLTIFWSVKSYNRQEKNVDQILNVAMNQTLPSELEPYDALTDEQREMRWNDLISAIDLGNIQVVKKLLKNVEFDPADDNSYELLLYAVRAKKNSGLVSELLIDSGLTDVNKILIGGRSLLHFAARKGNYEAAIVLINFGAEIDRFDADSEYGPSFHETPLHVSAQYGTWQVAKILLENGADFSLENIGGLTPLEVALQDADPDHDSSSGKRKVAELIRDYMKKDLKENR